MPARAMWKGVLRAGGVKLPVKLYAAVQDRSVHFHLLDDKGKQRVEQRMVDPDEDAVVRSEEVRKALEVEPGTFVVLAPEELAELDPEASRDIELTRFVPAQSIHHQWYDRPYWLGPDGGEEGYFALHDALLAKKREGVASWVMRNRPYVGALRPNGDHLMLIALRHTAEVVLPEEISIPEGRELDRREHALAEQLIGALAADFVAAEYHDTYRQRVEELIAAKAKGKRPKVVKAKAPRPTASLEAALAASLKAAGGGSGGSAKAKTARSSGSTKPKATTRTAKTASAAKAAKGAKAPKSTKRTKSAEPSKTSKARKARSS